MNLVIRLGWLVPVLLMLPNLLWMLLPKSGAADESKVPQWLNILENLGRLAILTLPFFYAFNLDQRYAVTAAVLMVLALAIYYAAWGRYFVDGRQARLLGASLFCIPLPMAVAPVVFLLLSSYLLNSWPLFAASILFGVAHIWVSALSLKPA